VLTEAYKAFRDFELNVPALNELRKNSEFHKLRFFQ
jgi:hypothetical protein